jgi:hypothetical protein
MRTDPLVLEAEEQAYPVSGNRRFYSGFYDRAAGHGKPTGSGPGFEAALAKFEERQRQNGLPGLWGCPNNLRWNVSKGNRRDTRFYIMEWI